ncbi:protein bric-a-brac 1-like isoform X3 [Amphibalanus amphitrite]|uniref:protein bric-a-brac 1-like isoform X3 n=1 Tax=Amphibalanus amphitrite TaxID=1232801 RepID=UPI001C9247C4|nr:protein bric-a-brac 1-like isoform X3 [Amphibalanus amphitrite]
MNSQKFCLKWDHFRTSVTSVFNHLRRDGELVDITLCCEGQRVKAHRMMLSACSPYFRELLKENPCQHPVFFLKDTSAEDLRAVIEFVYNGEVNVAQGQLASFIKTAEMLQIRGLSGEDEDGAAGPVSGGTPAADRRPPPAAPPERPRSPPSKRRRRSGSPPESAAPAPAPAGPPPVPRSQPPPPPPPSQPDEITVSDHSPVNVKVEADLAKTEDDPSLEAALGRVVYNESDAELTSLTADDSLGEAGPSGGLSAERSMQAAELPQLSALDAHGRLVCTLCGRSYRSRDSFRHHVETHAGKTTCPHCQQTFATASNRSRHAQTCPCRPAGSTPVGSGGQGAGRVPPAGTGAALREVLYLPERDGVSWQGAAPGTAATSRGRTLQMSANQYPYGYRNT